mmetsp:Transcript_58090/g.123363  ORF Transcript_58090/g.123363 Transcript_58090/m.123363 type:complete len:121 (-) Transcript_58090:339-701(-)
MDPWSPSETSHMALQQGVCLPFLHLQLSPDPWVSLATWEVDASRHMRLARALSQSRSKSTACLLAPPNTASSWQQPVAAPMAKTEGTLEFSKIRKLVMEFPVQRLAQSGRTTRAFADKHR